MADAQARALERDNSLEGRARVLVWRLRVGEECGRCEGRGRERVPLPTGVRWGQDGPENRDCPACAGLTLQERVELAAYVGDEVARLAVGWKGYSYRDFCTPQASCCGPDPCLAALARGLSRWGQVCVRAALAAGRVALETLECAHEDEDERGCWDCKNTGYDNAEGQPAEAAIDAAQAWVDRPCAETSEAAHRAHDACEHPTPWGFIASAAAMGSDCSEGLAEPSAVIADAVKAIECASQLTSEHAVRRAIRAALVPWALAHP